MVWGLALAAIVAGPSWAQERDYELERRIEAAKEEIRTLMSKERYQEVIQRADALLLIDPHNASATVWKDQAQLLLAAPQESRNSILGSEGPKIGAGPTPTPRPVVQPVYTPVPMTERTASSGSGLGLPIGLLIGLAVGALAFVGLAVFAVARVGASRKRNREVSAAMAATAVADSPTSAPQADGMHDAVTHVSAGHRPPVLADDDSVVQYGSVGRRDPETLSDQETMSDPVTRGATPMPEEEEEEGPALTFQPSPLPPPPAPKKPAAAAPPPPPAKPAAPPPAPDPVTGISLDFGVGPDQPTEAPEEMTFGSLMFKGADETKAPPASAKKDDDAMSFNSLMFAGESQTKQPDEEDPAAMSFDSLMFKGADETRMPGAAPSKPEEAEDPNAMSYTSMMFGGDETVAPGAAPKKPAAKPAAKSAVDPLDALGETVRLSGGAPSADEATLDLPPPETPGGMDLENTIRFADDDDNK